MKSECALDFPTPRERWSKEERNKRQSKSAFEGSLYSEFRSPSPDIPLEAEQIAKAHGIYLEFDRSKKGDLKDWMYMVRVAVPGGGPSVSTCAPMAGTPFTASCRQAQMVFWA